MHRANEKDQDHFDSLVTPASNALKQTLSISEDLLIGGASFFSSNEHMNSKAWKNYVENLNLPIRHPGFLGMGYAEFIPKGVLKTFHTSNLWLIERRNDYIITKYFEPAHPKNQIINDNIGSDPIKREAAEKARDSGHATLSQKNLLFTSNPNLFGAYLFVPIYKRGMPIKSLDDRRTALKGWVFMPLNIEQILNTLRSPQDTAQFDFDVFDIFDEKKNRPVSTFFNKTNAINSQQTQPPQWSKLISMDLYGANWIIRAKSLPSYKSTQTNNDPMRILWGSSILIILLWALIFSLIYTRRSALALALNTSQDLARAKNNAISASRIKSEFLANMSHEIRTPLFAMSGMLDLLLDMHLTSEQKHHVQTCRQSVATLTSLINDILDLSKVEAGKLDIETIPFNLHRLLTDVGSVAKAAAARKGVQYSLDIQPDLPVQVEGDPNRLQQILSNLLNNAVKFTAQGKISIKASVESSNADIVQIKIAVSDTGIGLSNNALLALFKPFAQTDITVSRIYGGAGLGLFISKGLVTLMRGTIGVQSRNGEGSTFWFILPFNKSLDLATDTSTKTKYHSPVALHPKRLLVVEDNLINQEVTTKIIVKMGHYVDCVSDGDQVIEQLEKNKYDLVIMDCRMHRVNGYEATKLIRNHLNSKIQTIPIIAMTANAIASEREKCLQAGMDDYISKPINRTLFENMVSKWLNEIKPITSELPPTTIDRAALENLGNLDHPDEESIIIRCFNLFLKTTPNCLSSMQNALWNHDFVVIYRIAHSLKTSCATLGAHRMAGICLQLEETPSNVGTQTHQQLLNQLKIEFDLATEELHNILSNKPH